jgi:hypothetical protein
MQKTTMQKATNRKKTITKKVITLISSLVAISFVFVVVGCSKKEEPAPQSAPTPKYWPLTHIEGNPVDRSAVSVKIENDPEARPQSGLEDADIVWETMVEGGVTRFIAVFNSKMPEDVGPVRSLRLADGAIVGPMKGLIVFSGSNGQRFQQVARDAGTQTIEEDAGAAGFHRIPDRYEPHNDYYILQDALAQADDDHKKAPAPQFEYANKGEKATAEEKGKAVKEMINTMSSAFVTSWQWDAQKKAFLRFQEGVPFVCAAGPQIQATNVISLNVETSGTPEIDPAGTPEMDMHIVSSGKGTVMSGGKQISVNWEKKSEDAVLQLTTTIKDKDDKEESIPVKLNPGNTWIELVPVTDNGATVVS